MSVKTAHRPGQVSRNRFMIAVLGGIGGVIGLFYLGELVRYLYPQGGSDTPPLPVTLGEAGVTPHGGVLLPWNRGVAGPFYYPMNLEKSVVVGMFVEQKVADGRLTADNLRAVEQTCTHLGCPVNWIATDNRFECPCHGSQFNRNTTVYHGPAPRPLWQHKYTLSGDTMTIYGREST